MSKTNQLKQTAEEFNLVVFKLLTQSVLSDSDKEKLKQINQRHTNKVMLMTKLADDNQL